MHWWYHNGNVVGNNEKVHASSSILKRFQIAAAFKKKSRKVTFIVSRFIIDKLYSLTSLTPINIKTWIPMRFFFYLFSIYFSRSS